MKRDIHAMYLDYFNNFLSIANWCEYYGITKSTGLRIHSLMKKLGV